MHVAAVLKGRAAEEVTIPALGDIAADCRGGPRMPEGERALLFLTHVEAGSRPHDLLTTPSTLHVVAVGQGRYLLTNGEALFKGYGTAPPAVDAEALIREVGLLTDAPTDEVERAVLFAAGASDSTELEAGSPEVAAVNGAGVDEASRWGWMLLGAILAAVLAVTIAISRVRA